jgi:hypothetical protein
LLCRRWEEEEEEVLDVGGGSDKKCAFDMKTKEREMGIIKRRGIWTLEMEVGREAPRQSNIIASHLSLLPSISFHSFSISYCYIRFRS